MSREIKFRIFDKKEKKFVKGYEYPFGNDNGIYIDPENGDINKISDGDDSFHVENVNEIQLDGEFYYDCILQQFTGLKDKNGVDIYEGDIIRHLIFDFFDVDQKGTPTYNKNEVVTFHNGAFCLNDDFASFGNMGHTYEVIGNIYQNPELITNEV